MKGFQLIIFASVLLPSFFLPLATVGKSNSAAPIKRWNKPKAVTQATATKSAAKLADTIWDASHTSGMAAMSYAAAKAQPELMSKLFCYCGCDASEKMSSLLSCFQTDHSVDCNICRDEALLAVKLKKDGMPLRDIQKHVDDQFAIRYPYREKTEFLKQYEASRDAK